MKKRVYILPNNEKPKAVAAADGICKKITEWDFDARVSAIPESAEDAGYLSDADYLVVLGGDGTILQVARATVEINVPIVGINYGKVGYMAVLGSDDLDELRNILLGKYSLQSRIVKRYCCHFQKSRRFRSRRHF